MVEFLVEEDDGKLSATGLCCRQKLKHENLDRLRQINVVKCVLHVRHRCFPTCNQSHPCFFDVAIAVIVS